MNATLPDEFLLPTDREIPSGGAPRVAIATLLAGTVVLSTEYTGLGALLVGVWSSGKAESPIQLIEKGIEVGSHTGRFRGRAPQISTPLFQPAQWVTAGEIIQIPAPFQRATVTPGRESTIQLKKRRRGSGTGSQVIWLSRSHPPQRPAI